MCPHFCAIFLQLLFLVRPAERPSHIYILQSCYNFLEDFQARRDLQMTLLDVRDTRTLDREGYNGITFDSCD